MGFGILGRPRYRRILFLRSARLDRFLSLVYPVHVVYQVDIPTLGGQQYSNIRRCLLTKDTSTLFPDEEARSLVVLAHLR